MAGEAIESVEYKGQYPEEFSFESYGVAVRIKCGDRELASRFRELIDKTMLGRIKPIEMGIENPDLEFRFAVDENNNFFCYENGKLRSEPTSYTGQLQFYDSYLRIKIAEYARNVVFVHAGVAAWKDKAIVIPGNSYSGKTTLIAELVKCGAEYFSDEYAIFDSEGFVHPFPRDLQIREEGEHEQTKVPVAELGGTAAERKLPAGLIVVTKYSPDAVWEPAFLSPGEAVVEMVPHTIPIKRDPAFSLKVLKCAAERAIILRGERNQAIRFAETLINFLDSNN
jgi:hypothetical protein